MLGLMELLELLRLLARDSLGLKGLRPDVRANRLRTSDKEITPIKRPDMRAPGRAAAETAGNEGDAGTDPIGCATAAWESDGVVGVDGDGEADSTTHIRCDLVATSFATECARVE